RSRRGDATRYTPGMIIVMRADLPSKSHDLDQVVRIAEGFPGIKAHIHVVQGASRAVTEVHLHGVTVNVPTKPFEDLEGVERVVRVSEKYRSIGRHGGQMEALGF